MASLPRSLPRFPADLSCSSRYPSVGISLEAFPSPKTKSVILRNRHIGSKNPEETSRRCRRPSRGKLLNRGPAPRPRPLSPQERRRCRRRSAPALPPTTPSPRGHTKSKQNHTFSLSNSAVLDVPRYSHRADGGEA